MNIFFLKLLMIDVVIYTGYSALEIDLTSLIDINLTVLDCGVMNSACESSSYGDLYIYCFYANGTSARFLANPDGADKFFESDLFNGENKLFIYSHGFGQSYDNCQSQQITRPLRQLNDVTACAVNAEVAYAIPDYISAAKNTNCVGKQIGAFCARLSERGVDPSTIHVAGHSLGGQASGYAGRWFQLFTGGLKIGRVTALDQAGPCFTPATAGNTVSSTDATHVDVYHCNEGILGSVGVGGDADFYPNCGFQQSGCTTPICSHGYCIKIFAESITDGSNCLAIKCKSCDDFVGRKFTNETTQAGFYWDGKPGIFYYYTNAKKPYCKGKRGIEGKLNIVEPNLNPDDVIIG